MEERKYRDGQTVTLLPSRARRTPTDRFEIVRLMPAERGAVYQYRIRSTLDGHERIAMESELEVEIVVIPVRKRQAGRRKSA
ncbi:MAG TPA: hypothetical protein VMC10_25440 [Stellaceae bacterium]|nr:hypothetical protein [Stellaceae bacterium]